MNKLVENIKTFNINILNMSSIIKDDINSIELITKWIEEAINKKEYYLN